MTLEVVKISMESKLDIVSLPSHTSHALQPLDIACFKPFKTAFRQIRDAWCLTNKNLPVEKQTLCEWTSTALKWALTAPNIQVGFRRAGIWPLDREAAKSSMAPASGFEEGQDAVDSHDATGRTGHGAGGVTCPTGHPNSDEAVVTGRAGQERSVQGARCMHAASGDSDGISSSTSDGLEADSARWGALSDVELAPTPSPPGISEDLVGGVHYYVDVPNSEDTAYEACDKDALLQPGLEEHLQEEGEVGDISTFLALPEIIPARQRRRQQPLLDFTKSKILTSRTYTEACECLLAQKVATQAEAKRKAELREATKETRWREKDEHQLQVAARKEARNVKQEEKSYQLAERKALRGLASRDAEARPMRGSPLRSPNAAAHASSAAALPPPHFAELDSFPAAAAPNRTAPPASSALPDFQTLGVPEIHWTQASSQPSPPFWNNPMLGMPHMFHHPLLSHHNGNSPWAPQISMPGTGDVRGAPNFQGGQLLAEDMATSGSHRDGLGTW